MKPAVRHPDEGAEFETAENCLILEVANDAGDEGVSISRARVRAGEGTAWHVLREIDERYIVVGGTGRVEVGDLEPEDVGPGSVVRIPRGTPQRIHNTGQGDLVFWCVCTPRFRSDRYEEWTPDDA